MTETNNLIDQSSIKQMEEMTAEFYAALLRCKEQHEDRAAVLAITAATCALIDVAAQCMPKDAFISLLRFQAGLLEASDGVMRKSAVGTMH